MIKEAIQSLVLGRSLATDEAALVMEELMDGKATPAQIGAFIIALSMKGETVDELVGMVKTMRAKAVRVSVSMPVLDTCGTGGDNLNTFNISTAAALAAAGAGLVVAKHGNRAMSSHCGSADVLEALGVRIDLNAGQVKRCLEEAGIGFMFAPIFHPATKNVSGARREIGIRTIFNVLGPLSNPAGAQYQVIGVPSQELGTMISAVLYRLGTKHTLIVHGLNGMDEVSIAGRTQLWEIRESELSGIYKISPQDFGVKKGRIKDIEGGTPAENAVIIRQVLQGKQCPQRNAVLINAAVALVAGERVVTLKEGAELAGEVIDSGKALESLEKLVKLSQSMK